MLIKESWSFMSFGSLPAVNKFSRDSIWLRWKNSEHNGKKHLTVSRSPMNYKWATKKPKIMKNSMFSVTANGQLRNTEWAARELVIVSPGRRAFNLFSFLLHAHVCVAGRTMQKRQFDHLVETRWSWRATWRCQEEVNKEIRFFSVIESMMSLWGWSHHPNIISNEDEDASNRLTNCFFKHNNSSSYKHFINLWNVCGLQNPQFVAKRLLQSSLL